MSFECVALCQPGGAAINFSKITRNKNQTTLLLLKTISYPLLLKGKFVTNALYQNCEFLNFEIAPVRDDLFTIKSSQTREILEIKKSQF